MTPDGPLHHPRRRTLRLAVSRRPDGHLLTILLVIILTQRLGVPVGSEHIPLTLPLVLLVVIHGLLTRQLVVDPVRSRLYTVGVGSLLVLTVVAVVREQSPSLPSLAFVVATYALAVIRPPGMTEQVVDRLLDIFVNVMCVMAVVGLVQLAVQYAGLPGEDWLQYVVPPQWLQAGYNTGDPIVYGSSIIRVNGVVFLEPSFLSYFLGLAAIAALHRRRRVAVISLLLLGIIPTSAGNGVALLLLGIVAMALGQRRRNLTALTLPAAAAIALAVVTPFGARFLHRATEVGASGTSSSLRLVEPYQRFADVWLADPASMLVGHGAGSAPSRLQADETVGLLVPVLPKLLIEYGTLGAVLFLAFLLWSLLHGGGERPWTFGVLVSYIVLNAALLQVTFALTTIVFIHLLRVTRYGPPEGGDTAEAVVLVTEDVGDRAATDSVAYAR